MSHRFKFAVAAVAVPLAIACLLQACAGGNEQGPQANSSPGVYEMRTEQSAVPSEQEQARATEERLEQLAESIKDVKDANCVLIGDMAIVGIDVGGDLDRSRVGTIKYAVAEAMRHDPVGVDAIVTADMDLYHRLQEIRQDFADGRAMEGLAEEMADIVGRIVPQMPRDTHSTKQPQDPEAVTQEGAEQQAGSMDNAPGGEPQRGEPQDNRDFLDGSTSGKGSTGSGSMGGK